MIRPATSGWVLLIVVVAAACVGCAGQRSGAAASRRISTAAPARFARIDSALTRSVTLAHQGDAAGVRRLRKPVVDEGLALLRSRLPHDLARADVPRFLAARAFFGEALKVYVEALSGADDAAVFDATRGLYEATRGWIAAYQGLATETSI